MPNINLIYYLIAGGIFGALALKTGIPAAPLAGALIGASILSISGKIDAAQWPIGTRTILEIGIGTVIGTSLTKDSLVELQNLWRPAINNYFGYYRFSNWIMDKQITEHRCNNYYSWCCTRWN